MSTSVIPDTNIQSTIIKTYKPHKKTYKPHKKMKRTNKKKNHRCSIKKRKRTRKTGGKAKIDTAYTYLAFNLDKIQQYPLLNAWIHQNSLLCSCKSVGTPSENCQFTNPSGWVIGENQEIILVSKFDILQNLYFGRLDLNNQEHFDTIINNTLGFCIINAQTINDNYIISIYDVCIPKPKSTGYGKVLFAVIMTYLELTYGATDPILWLGIKIDNIEFNKLCNLYTSFGFAEPFITYRDPFGTDIGFPVLSLSKKLSYYVNVESSTNIVFNKAVYMKDNFLSKSVANFNIMFDKTCLFKMRLFPYLTIGGITPLEPDWSPIKQHREYSGNLIIINNSYENKSLLCNLSFETIGNNSNINFIEGTTGTVPLVHNSYTYHTHPIALYAEYNCSIGTPSGGDLSAFFRGLLPYMNINDGLNSYERSSISHSHFVIAVEGIYCISLHPGFISSRLNRTLTIINNDVNLFNLLADRINSKYEFGFQNRQYNWGEILVDYQGEAYPEKLVQTHLQKYFTFFNRVNNYFDINGERIGPIFQMDFKSWNDLFDKSEERNKMFNIHIPNIYQNSFVPSSDFKIVPHIYGSQLIENMVDNKAYDYEYKYDKSELEKDIDKDYSQLTYDLVEDNSPDEYSQEVEEELE